jgi:hypothetical protein
MQGRVTVAAAAHWPINPGIVGNTHAPEVLLKLLVASALSRIHCYSTAHCPTTLLCATSQIPQQVSLRYVPESACAACCISRGRARLASSASLRAMVTPASASLGLHALATTWQRDARRTLGRTLLKQRALLAALHGAELAVRVESAMVKQARLSSVCSCLLLLLAFRCVLQPNSARNVLFTTSI